MIPPSEPAHAPPLSHLPGADLIRTGLDDLLAGHESEAALLVSIGAPRLRQLLNLSIDNAIANPEHRLYRKLQVGDPDTAHTRYNALIRRLVRFEHAVACVA